mmetsp:Transcript_151/g.354  ORF Transcript_151/g.354 Transcript_151/m.354 type:complete len:123 (-) Transcript_151:37-405(-)
MHGIEGGGLQTHNSSEEDDRERAEKTAHNGRCEAAKSEGYRLFADTAEHHIRESKGVKEDMNQSRKLLLSRCTVGLEERQAGRGKEGWTREDSSRRLDEQVARQRAVESYQDIDPINRAEPS